MEIYCCSCRDTVQADAVLGDRVYPHRKDLHKLMFYQCGACNNFVGTHRNSMRPLGVIATPAIKQRRQQIHRVLDPLWQHGPYTRNKVYSILSDRLGKEYHTANIRSLAEADQILDWVIELQLEATS